MFVLKMQTHKLCCNLIQLQNIVYLNIDEKSDVDNYQYWFLGYQLKPLWIEAAINIQICITILFPQKIYYFFE